MRIWFDVLSPKQLLFFEPMIRDLGRKNRVLCTSRRYREVSTLARIRGLPVRLVGRFGGGDRLGKLRASIGRAGALAGVVDGFGPDLAISSHSPEASRISFGLGVRHIGFTDSPHIVPLMKLHVPFVRKLFCPWIIPKREFVRFGIAPGDVIHYRAIDAALIARRAVPRARPRFAAGKKTILVRPPEVQSSYMVRADITDSVIRGILGRCGGENVVVLSRYAEQKRALESRFGSRIKVMNMTYDGKALLEACDVFVGSGGTMTAESALMGVPTISYNAVPNYVERYLVRRRLAVRERDPARIASRAAAMLDARDAGVERARREVAAMEDPYPKLLKVMRSLT